VGYLFIERETHVSGWDTCSYSGRHEFLDGIPVHTAGDTSFSDTAVSPTFVLAGDAMNNLINQNWRIILEDLGKPVFTAVGGIVNRILTNVSKKIPYNELFTK